MSNSAEKLANYITGDGQSETTDVLIQQFYNLMAAACFIPSATEEHKRLLFISWKNRSQSEFSKEMMKVESLGQDPLSVMFGSILPKPKELERGFTEALNEAEILVKKCLGLE